MSLSRSKLETPAMLVDAFADQLSDSGSIPDNSNDTFALDDLVMIMRAENRKYHFIYRVTCIITNRFYIGMHSTDNLNDRYKGSGQILWYSRRKHGNDNHKLEIIKLLESRQALRDAEIEEISKHKNDPLCMNIAKGGDGGWDFVNESGKCPLHQKHSMMSQELRENINLGKKKAARHPSRISVNIDNLGEGMLGKAHSDDTKAKMSASHLGSANSQFGTRWMNKNGEVSKVKSYDWDLALKLGWKFGRK